MAKMFATILSVCLVGSISAAPVHELSGNVENSLQSRQFLLLSPEAQLQLQPAFKLQQPILQPLAPLGKIQTPNEQLILYYPSVSLSESSPGSTKQYDMLWNQINTIVQGWGFQPIPVLLPPSMSKPDGDDSSSEKFALNGDAETISPESLPKTPADTIPLPAERRIYVVGGRPQFFGNFDALQNPLNPIFSLQPLQPIKARSIVDPIAEINSNEKISVQPSIPASDSLPLAVSIRSGLEESQQSAEEMKGAGIAARSFARFLEEQKLIQPQSEQILVNPQQHGVAAQEFAKFLAEGRSQSLGPNMNNAEMDDKNASPMSISDDTSIAQARPVALAISGKGGLAQSVPLSTAIVGNNGVAIASPAATSLAGDFFEEERKAVNSDMENEKIKME